MAGVRIYHPTLRNCTYTVEHPRKYIVPLLCSVCDHVHERKTYHLHVDGSGYCIVSVQVLERLRQVGMAGFTEPQEVAHPPTITISQAGMRMQVRPRIVRHYLNSDS